MAKGKHSKKGGKKSNTTDNLIRLDNKEFKNTVKNGNESSLPDKFMLSKLFTPKILVIDEFTDEEKALMKESNSSTMIKFIISTSGVDRDGDTINVDGWNLKNFRKNPVVPWAHNYGQPPVARAIGTKVEEKNLVSKAMFTGEDLYPFGHMIGRMYRLKFLNAVSVGFNPTKFVFVEDSERKFGIDFLEQELLEYSAVPVPSNPEALIQARSKGIDIAPMKEYLEELMDHRANMKGLDMDVMEKLIKIFNTSTTHIGKTPDDEEETYEISEDENEIPDTPAEDSDNLLGDSSDTNTDNNEDSDSVDNEEDEKSSKGKVTVWMNEDGTIIEVDDSKSYEHITLENCIECSKELLQGEHVTKDTSGLYLALSKVLKDKYEIEIFDFKYVDSKVLKNFPERYNFDEKTGLLIERTQKDIEAKIIKTQVAIIVEAFKTIKDIKPDFKFKEKREELILELNDSVVDDKSKNNGEPENVITLDGIDNVEDLKSILKDSANKSIKATFNKLTGKLD